MLEEPQDTARLTKQEHAAFIKRIQRRIKLPDMNTALGYLLETFLLSLRGAVNNSIRRNQVIKVVPEILIDIVAEWENENESRRQRKQQDKLSKSAENDNKELDIDPNEDEFIYKGTPLTPLDGGESRGSHVDVYKNGKGFRAKVKSSNIPRGTFLKTYATSKQAAVSRLLWLRKHGLPSSPWEEYVVQIKSEIKKDNIKWPLYVQYEEPYLIHEAWDRAFQDGVPGMPSEKPAEACAIQAILERIAERNKQKRK